MSRFLVRLGGCFRGDVRNRRNYVPSKMIAILGWTWHGLPRLRQKPEIGVRQEPLWHEMVPSVGQLVCLCLAAGRKMVCSRTPLCLYCDAEVVGRVKQRGHDDTSLRLSHVACMQHPVRVRLVGLGVTRQVMPESVCASVLLDKRDDAEDY